MWLKRSHPTAANLSCGYSFKLSYVDSALHGFQTSSSEKETTERTPDGHRGLTCRSARTHRWNYPNRPSDERALDGALPGGVPAGARLVVMMCDETQQLATRPCASASEPSWLTGGMGQKEITKDKLLRRANGFIRDD
ncbi:hypothetical protein MRX96_004240 [Rhipicephalus microplus]